MSSRLGWDYDQSAWRAMAEDAERHGLANVVAFELSMQSIDGRHRGSTEINHHVAGLQSCRVGRGSRLHF